MKKIMIFAIMIFLVQKNGTAQFSSIFGNGTSNWEILTGFCDSWCSNTFETIGDTTIGTENYKIIGSSTESVFLREDTTQGKVWYYDDSENSEFLLMDLNLTVGDTFPIFNYSSSQMENFTVDSVYFVNNKKHIRLLNYVNLCTLIDFPLEFVEGIGTSSGLTYKQEHYKNKIVLCHTKDGIINPMKDNHYQGYFNFIDSCEYCVSNTHQLFTASDFIIYPNPFMETINITSEEYTINYEIYDMKGRIVKSEKTNDNLHSIDTQDLKTGTYILVLKYNNRIIASEKLIKIK